MILRGKKLRYLALFVLLIPLIMIISMFVYGFFLPEKINVKTGQESTINFIFPLRGEIAADNVQVLSVNNEPVKENIKVDFSEPATFLADTGGKWKMKLSLWGLPIKTVQVQAIEKESLVAGGEIVGIKINTNGVLVLGTGDVKTYDNKYTDPSDGKVKTGDLIQKIDNTPVQTKEDLITAVENSQKDSINLTISRQSSVMNVEITPVVSIEDGKKKLGLWVRDSTQGIGTLTYYDKDTGIFGALGHPVTDVDTGDIMEIKDGNIYTSKVVDIQKGAKGEPGQITGEIAANEVLGTVTQNNNCGIYGTAEAEISGKEYEIALKNQVKTGKASILSYLEGECVEYDIEILAVNTFNKNNSKGMIIKITDKRLLEKTGGIVQGMSGSPIIQNGKLVGAVTHVFIQDPTKGYGIFIENML